MKHEIIEELFESLLQRYEKGLEEKMRGSEFVYGNVNLLHYKLHKISRNRAGSDVMHCAIWYQSLLSVCMVARTHANSF